MPLKNPLQLKNGSLQINGVDKAGQVTKVKLIEHKSKVEEYQPAGAFAPIEANFGMEKPEFGFTMVHRDNTVDSLVGILNDSGTSFLFSGALNDDESTNYRQLSIEVEGAISSHAPGDMEPGTKGEVEYTITDIRYYREVMDGQETFRFDRRNIDIAVGGVSQTASAKAAMRL